MGRVFCKWKLPEDRQQLSAGQKQLPPVRGKRPAGLLRAELETTTGIIEAMGCLQPIRGTSVSLAGAGAAGTWSHTIQCTAAELGEGGSAGAPVPL